MRLPLTLVVRRGVVFLFTEYDKLDDPALAGSSKPKFGVVLSASAQDDPLVYLLTTSEKPKHSALPFAQDLFEIPAGTYEFFKVTTLIDVGQAGELEIDRAKFEALYEAGLVLYQGKLTDDDVNMLLRMIHASVRISRRLKQLLPNPNLG